jgi:hypothetical protein
MTNKINDTKLNYLFINNAKYNIVFLYKHYFFSTRKGNIEYPIQILFCGRFSGWIIILKSGLMFIYQIVIYCNG